jgi:hypothetical protein
MRRIALALSILLAFAISVSVSPNPTASAEGTPPVPTTSVNHSGPKGTTTTSDVELCKVPGPEGGSTYRPCPPPTPSTTIVQVEPNGESYETTTTTTPSAGTLVTKGVTKLGTKVYSMEQPLSLQATRIYNGSAPNTTVTEFKLCAVGHDAIVPDTGDYMTFLKIIHLPKDGVISSGDYEDWDADAEIVIDNTPMVYETATLYPGQDAKGLESVLKQDTCTTARAITYTDQTKDLAIGFGYTTIPFGEPRLEGGYTHLDPQAEYTTIEYEWEVN